MLYSCSMWGTDITEVEGQWLLSNWPNCSVLKTQMTALRLMLTSLIQFPPNSMRDHCDIITWCHDQLLYFFSRKTTAHVQRICPIHLCICQHHHQSLQLLLLHMNPLSFPHPQFCACDTLPRVFRCTLIPKPWIYLSTIHTKTLRMDTRYNCINKK